MMVKKIKSIINEFRMNVRVNNEYLTKQANELEWANIYHDTIKDKEWLKNLAISPGRWAGNYSFFYILVRILSDHKPKKIIEFGLGESSKVISTFLDNELKNSTHIIIEQDQNWIKAFKSRFHLSLNSELLHLPLEIKTIKNYPVNSYTAIKEKVTGVFDLYIIDGPFGSDNFSRYDICTLAEQLKQKDEFIIIIDDYNRTGEIETAKDLINQLTRKGIKIFTGTYSGNKSQIIITTEKYQFITTM